MASAVRMTLTVGFEKIAAEPIPEYIAAPKPQQPQPQPPVGQMVDNMVPDVRNLSSVKPTTPAKPAGNSWSNFWANKNNRNAIMYGGIGALGGGALNALRGGSFWKGLLGGGAAGAAAGYGYEDYLKPAYNQHVQPWVSQMFPAKETKTLPHKLTPEQIKAQQKKEVQPTLKGE